MTRKIEFDDDGNVVNQPNVPNSGGDGRVLSPRPPQLRTRPAFAQDVQPETPVEPQPSANIPPERKTRVLKPEAVVEDDADNGIVDFVTGWFVVLDGPGRGTSHKMGHGVSNIGRGQDQDISLDFGDDAISREAHAYAAYDDEQRCFYINHGGKSNLVRLNGKPLLNMSELESGDEIRIGKTKLRFIALCGPDFDWAEN